MMVWDDLPEEVFGEIFCRLPIKSILQCTSVCKLWYSLIKNPNFISNHLQKTLSTIDNRLFFHRYNSDSFTLRFDDLTEYMTLNPPVDHKKDLFHVAGSCNGLICLFRDDFSSQKYGYRLLLWNPSIRKSLLLPFPRRIFASLRGPCRTFIGFGFDSKANDYKVLRIMKPNVESGEYYRAEVYSLNSDSWKDITEIVPKYGVDEYVVPAYKNSALHWAGTDWRNHEKRSFIMVFDLKDDTFNEILLPACLEKVYSSKLKVKIYGESSIAVIHESESYESHIWVMKEYGAVESWVHLATFGKQWRGKLTVLGFRKNGQVLMEFGRSSFIASQIEGQRVRNLLSYEKGGWSSLYSHVESLVLLDKGNYATNYTAGPWFGVGSWYFKRRRRSN